MLNLIKMLNKERGLNNISWRICYILKNRFPNVTVLTAYCSKDINSSPCTSSTLEHFAQTMYRYNLYVPLYTKIREQLLYWTLWFNPTPHRPVILVATTPVVTGGKGEQGCRPRLIKKEINKSSGE